MSTFYLIRHAETVAGPALRGRTPGIGLSPRGRGQASRLARTLAGVRFDLLCSSPRERTRETADFLAGERNLPVRIAAGLDEVDYGGWTGREIEDLQDDEMWRQFNTFRSGTRIPGGESMPEVQVRMVRALESLREELPNGTIAVVGHADPLRAAVAFYAGIPLDLMLRIDLDHASFSVVHLHDWGPRIACLNVRPDGLPER